MRKRAATLLFIISAFLAAPVAIVLTLMLHGFWDWIENKTGIESLGHSGPAGWCYFAVYAIFLTALLIPLLIRLRKPPQNIH